MVDVRQRTTIGNRFRFLVRVLGLTGLVAAVVGAVLLSTVPTGLPAWSESAARSPMEWLAAAANWVAGSVQWLWDTAQTGPDTVTRLAAGVLLGGLAAIAVWLVVELLGALFLVTGRRTAVGLNTYLQIGLAAALLLIVNAYSFVNYQRYDLTRDRQFTLPESVVERLRTFSPSAPTDIVVLQLHKTAGSLSDKPDALDFAAERKVVEKVRDLVDQLRELGPRFRVTVLDVEEEGYEDRLDALTKNAPELRRAIEGAPENSIFFHADRRVQRMSFSDFYLLDRSASQQEVNGRKRISNLVLIPQGVESFARKVESVGEKRPTVGLAVIHPVLTTQDDFDEYTAQGLRRSLEANGFEVRDIILKRWGRGNPTPAAYTFDEYELDRVEGRYNLLTLMAQNRESLIKQLSTALEAVAKTQTTADAAKVLQPFVRGRIEDEDDVKQVVASIKRAVEEFQEDAEEIQEALAKAAPRYQEVLKNERAYEARRSTDVKARFAAAVADCDILIIPRMTVMDIPRRHVIESWLYNLSDEQAEVIRDFIAAGKPVLALFGPIKVGQSGPGAEPEPDPVEQLFTRLGIEFGGQTIMYQVEAEAAAERQEETLGGGSVPLPPLVFDIQKEGRAPNPIAAAFLTTARAVDFQLDVNKSGFRPVYVSPAVLATHTFNPIIAETTRDAWNEERPIAERDYVPKYEPTKLDDPKRGTRDEERRGPFPVGVSVEVPVPAEWLEPKLAAAQAAAAVGGGAFAPGGLAVPTLDPAKFKAAVPPERQPDPPTVRIVALGHGGLFVGNRLEPAREKLLLHTLNWQLRRDDRLPTATQATWQYPRVELTPQQHTLWRWGTFLGLPLLCAYFGLIVLMVRKVR
jgi:ribosomal protein L17